MNALYPPILVHRLGGIQATLREAMAAHDSHDSAGARKLAKEALAVLTALRNEVQRIAEADAEDARIDGVVERVWAEAVERRPRSRHRFRDVSDLIGRMNATAHPASDLADQTLAECEERDPSLRRRVVDLTVVPLPSKVADPAAVRDLMRADGSPVGVPSKLPAVLLGLAALALLVAVGAMAALR